MTKKRILAFLIIVLSIVSCSKDEPTSSPAIAFTQSEGKAVNGQYTITGTITSSVSLLKVIVTKEGDTTPFIIDDTTAKNKNSYPYSYLITGITKDTYILIDIYDQNNTKTSTRFLIRI
ncbi:hypothetical protein H4V97_001170 [Flavobacterium sp. CG_23.5]|uniref:hypothetical protein n=1 Tax=unclassified Flavobacterium TaxID=196869 RepID=UPI0018CBE7AF|nr:MULTISPECIES: hypothetical protein [unclassified Flavobacterium]MBG6110744.1 hypothetical protein [Flavobacterium sp. CG_9.10]MBP2282852.1 hypothetical protein [Flavobacterium sp. CG_23.5]